MNNNIFERTIALLGNDKFTKLSLSTVAVFGLGGVGGTAVEALVRSGIGHVVLIDFDVVSISNLNRQILYAFKDVGHRKIDAAKDHLLSINPSLKIETLNLRINEDTIKELNNYKIDYIVDAIDDVKGKVAIAKYAKSYTIPLIISLGMANRLDSTSVEVIRLDKTTNDPLARKLRYEYKEAGLSTKEIISVCSKEAPIKDGVNLNSIMTVPSSAGLAIATYIIQNI